MNSIEILPLKNPVTKSLVIPGSKSITNRALILGSMTNNPIKIINPLWCDDTRAMVNCLKCLGISIRLTSNAIFMDSTASRKIGKQISLNVDLSGTTLRFVLALSCTFGGIKKIFGEKSLSKRPIKELVTALSQLGAEVQYLKKEGYLPLKVLSQKLSSGKVEISGNISSQFISALLMIGPAINGIRIVLETNPISKSYIDLTIDMMKTWGVEVDTSVNNEYFIKSNLKYKMEEYVVEGDYSSASYFAAIAALTRSKIILKNINNHSKQGDRYFFNILQKMGNKILYEDNQVTVYGAKIGAGIYDMENCPDQAQTLAVLAAFANGKSILTGVRSLRVKETERVRALQSELAKMQIRTESPDVDTIVIYGGDPKPATIDTFNDHRMAMSFAVAGTKIKGMKINNPRVVNKTFPEFWKYLQQLGMSLIIKNG